MSTEEAEEAKKFELEEFGHSYFKYTKLFEDQAAVLCQDIHESNAAYARVLAETMQEQSAALLACSPEQIQLYLTELARQCEIVPQSFDDRWRICFSAVGYVRVMMDYVVAAPNRPFSDCCTVMSIGSQLLREDFAKQPPPTTVDVAAIAQLFREGITNQPPPIQRFVPPQVDLIPKEPVTRQVTQQEINYWHNNPEDLVGKGFRTIDSDEIMCDAFVVSDFSVKKVKGAQYDVIHQGSEWDIEAINLDTLLELVADCELVTNM